MATSMECKVKTGLPEKQRTGCMMVGVSEPKHLSPSAEHLDKLSQGYLRQILRKGDCDGKVGQTLLLQDVPGNQAERLLLFGCGSKPLSYAQFAEILRSIITTLNNTGVSDAVLYLSDMNIPEKSIAWKIRQAILIMDALQYSFADLKTQKPPRRLLRRLTFMVPTTRDLKAAERALSQGLAIAKGIELTKNLANLPANYCTPDYLAKKAKELAKSHPKLSTAVLEEKEMHALKMGLLLSVTAGSTSAAKLITMEYRGAGKAVKPIVLIGKGITFDTGGNSLKIHPHMIGMKYDMCGAATVFGVLQAAVMLDLPLNLIGVIPSCENMPGPNATRPEDILTSMSGLTVEVLNTDAEGRLILADALTYCERFQPEVVIDIATLTGACALALGNLASGLMSNHDPLAKDILQAGIESWDRAWQLPLWDEYQEALKSEFADLSNVPLVDAGARTIIAASFLAKFAKNFHWAHLDVANTASIPGGINRGATGRPVALLVQYLLNRCQ